MYKEIDTETIKLIQLYVKTYEYLMQSLKDKVSLGLSTRHTTAILKEIDEALFVLDRDTYEYCKVVFPEYYKVTGELVDEEVEQAGYKAIVGFQTTLHQNAIKKAANDMYQDLARNTRYMADEMKKVLQATSKDIIDRQKITGESRKTVQKELAEELQQQGVHSFVDAGNRRWNIARYADMLLGTKGRILANEGTMSRLIEYGEANPKSKNNFDLIQISRHGAKDWCKHYENTVWSISGESKVYPPVSELPNGYATLHPKCRHTFKPYIESLRGEGKVISRSFIGKSVKQLNREYYHLVKKAK
ncbi:phage minor capsid protein [Bacillus sp. SM2101]|uniref:phage minor capsid protein n=1 Tax=Bacillus sp. SM2101 TaxID=2805366 RepID=UPI001BDDE096